MGVYVDFGVVICSGGTGIIVFELLLDGELTDQRWV